MAVRELPQLRQMNMWLSGNFPHLRQMNRWLSRVLELVSMVLLHAMNNTPAILDTSGIRKSDTDCTDWYKQVNVAFMVRISPLTYPLWLRSLLVQIESVIPL